MILLIDLINVFLATVCSTSLIFGFNFLCKSAFGTFIPGYKKWFQIVVSLLILTLVPCTVALSRVLQQIN